MSDVDTRDDIDELLDSLDKLVKAKTIEAIEKLQKDIDRNLNELGKLSYATEPSSTSVSENKSK